MKISVRKFKCLDCNHEFEVPFGIPKWSINCENCGSPNIIRVDVVRADTEINTNKAFVEEEEMKNNESFFSRFFNWCRGWGRGFGKGRGCGWGRGWNRGLGRGFGKNRGWGKCG